MSRKSKAAEFLQDAYNITVTGRHVHVTEAMKSYAVEKVSRIERFSPRIIDVSIVMDIQKLEQRVELLLKIGHLKIMSQASTSDMYVSIDQAVDKLEAQLIKYRSRLRDQQRYNHQNAPEAEMTVNIVRSPTEDELLEFNGEIEAAKEQQILEKYQPHGIVAQETMPLRTLTYDEAIMKMELSGDSCLVFRHEADMKLKVIYRRNDGNFGIIATEAKCQ